MSDFEAYSVENEIVLRKIKNRFPIKTQNSFKCILCRRENVAICRYCFSIILTNILRELNFGEDFIENLGYSPMYGEVPLEEDGISVSHLNASP